MYKFMLIKIIFFFKFNIFAQGPHKKWLREPYAAHPGFKRSKFELLSLRNKRYNDFDNEP